MFLEEKEPVLRNEDSKIDSLLIVSDLSLTTFVISWYIFAPKVIVIVLLLVHILLIPYNKNLSLYENVENYKMYEFWIARMCIIAVPFILVSFSYQLRGVAWVLILGLLIERCFIFTPSSPLMFKSTKRTFFKFKHLVRGCILALVAAATVYSFYPVYRGNLITSIEKYTLYYMDLDHKLQSGAIMILFLAGVSLLGQCIENIMAKKELTLREKLTIYDFWVPYPTLASVISLELALYCLK